MLANLYRFFLLASIATAFTCSVMGQLPDYQLSLVQAQDGLKTPGIINMARDRDGFMWLASPGYVQRFDGRHTRHYAFPETVREIFSDQQNRKWVITANGIYRLIALQQEFRKMKFARAGESRIIHAYENDDGKFCVARQDGHYYFNEEQEEFRRYEPNIIPKDFRYDRYYGRTGPAFFFGAGDTVYRYDITTRRLSGIPLKRVFRIILIRPDEFLFSTTQYSTFYVNMNKGTVAPLDTAFISRTSPGKHMVLFGGVPLDSNRLLLAGNKGLLEYNLRERSFRTPVFFYNGRPHENQQSSTCLYKDAYGTVYMNHADGIFFIRGITGPIQYFRNYRYGEEQMPDNDIRNFSEDEEGNIWMATTNGIARLNPQDGRLKVYQPLGRQRLIDFPSYRQLLHDKVYLWIGTSGNGVRLLNKQTGQLRQLVFAATSEGKKMENLMNTAYVWEILKLQDGKFLVAGGSRLFVVNGETFEVMQVFPNPGNAISRSAIQDSAGRIWHGTTRGLYCIDDHFNPLFATKDSFPDKRIASFCELDKHTMLIGSKGLFEINVRDGKIGSFRRRNGIPADRLIYCMKKDRQGNIWMGTDDGIFRYDPERDESLVFDESDHVQPQVFNSDAAYFSRTGLMFMGGLNGVNFFDPAKVTPFMEPLHPVVTFFTTNGGDTFFCAAPASLRVPYRNRDIDFIFTAPEFRKPFRILYRYNLGKGNSRWTYTGNQNRVRINDLRPGNYQLNVSASYDGKRWFNSGGNFSFKILQPWWQTGWFRLLCVTVLVAMIWGFAGYRARKREAAEMKRAIEYFAHSGSEHSSTEDILWDIARNCISRLGLEDCVIYLADENKNVLVQKAAYGDKSPRDFEIANPIEIPIGSGICGYVAQTGKALIVNDTSKDPRYIIDNEKRSSEMAVPVIHEGKVIGVIDSEHSKKNFFRQEHLKTLQTIASVCSKKISASIAIEAAGKAAAELEVLNSKMQESKFKNLRLQMNPHFLFNILTTIQYLIVSQQTGKAITYLNIFSGFLRSILQYAEDTVVSLQEELRILAMYIELESLCLDETFTWEMTVADGIDQEEVQVPFMVFQPFVENAIHHGLLQKTGEKKFRISIEEYNDDRLSCVIEDNGIGRGKAAATNGKNLDSVIHKSRGIDIVKQRLELMRQKTRKDAGVEIEDLFENGLPAGTRVRIILSYYNREEI